MYHVTAKCLFVLIFVWPGSAVASLSEGLKGILKYEQQSWQKDAFIQGVAAERDQLNICLIYDCASNRFRAKLNCLKGRCNGGKNFFLSSFFLKRL